MTTTEDSRRELELARQALQSIDASSQPDEAARLHERVAALESALATPAEASDPAARALLRRAATGVLAIWAINLALSLVAYFAAASAGITFHFGLLLAAALLWSCNLRAALIVRWLACAYLGSAIFWLVAILRQPFDLSLSYVRLYPLQLLALTGTEILTWLACLGLARRLGGDAVMQARAAAGKRRRNMRIPLALGVIGGIGGAVFFVYLLNGPRVEHAELLARQSTGPGFRYYTDSMHIMVNGSAKPEEAGKQVIASVAAWNKDVVYHVPVRWREP